MNRYVVTIEGPGFDDLDEIELPRLPEEGEALETKLGTCVVTSTKDEPNGHPYAGRIVCRMP